MLLNKIVGNTTKTSQSSCAVPKETNYVVKDNYEPGVDFKYGNLFERKAYVDAPIY